MTTMSSRRITMSVTLMAAVMVTITGCLSDSGDGAEAESGFDAVSAAAEDEGTLTWYTSIPEDLSTAAAADFEEKHEISVETVVLTSGLLTTRYSTEMGSGSSPADVVTVADPVFYGDAVEEEWIDTVNSDDIPALSDWPEGGVREDSYVLVNVQPIGVTYDTAKAQAADFQDWQFLTDPQYQGEMYLVDPENVPNWLAHLKLLQETEGEDFVTSIANQGANVVDSAVPGAQQVAAGSGTFVYPSLLSVSLPLSSEGATVETVFPTPTTGVEQYAAISSQAAHPNAARLFMNYLLSEDAQKIINKDTGSSPLGDLEGTVPLPEGYVSPDVAGALAMKDELMSTVGL